MSCKVIDLIRDPFLSPWGNGLDSWVRLVPFLRLPGDQGHIKRKSFWLTSSERERERARGNQSLINHWSSYGLARDVTSRKLYRGGLRILIALIAE